MQSDTTERLHGDVELDWFKVGKTGKREWQGYILSLCLCNSYAVFSSVQSLSRVPLLVTPWTAAHQASLSITNSWSLLKFMSIESVMPSNQFILCHPLLLLPSIFPRIRVFSSESVLRIRWPKYWSFSIKSVLPMNIQNWSPLGWTLRMVGSPCSPRDSQESYPASQFKSINSSVFSFLYSPTQPWLDRPLLVKWCLCFLLCCLGWS